jgi:hypothetical protein
MYDSYLAISINYHTILSPRAKCGLLLLLYLLPLLRGSVADLARYIWAYMKGSTIHGMVGLMGVTAA